MTPDESLWAARKERARRWLQASIELRGYPVLPAEEEIEETLASEPTKQAEKKPKGRRANDGHAHRVHRGPGRTHGTRARLVA